jgi:hypothetical protein
MQKAKFLNVKLGGIYSYKSVLNEAVACFKASFQYPASGTDENHEINL